MEIPNLQKIYRNEGFGTEYYVKKHADFESAKISRIIFENSRGAVRGGGYKTGKWLFITP